MLGENIRRIRKTRGLTQEELAIRLNVVRQTVSKWEKGRSVPDAELLQKLADVLEVDITYFLGSSSASAEPAAGIAEQLARINEQLAIHNRRARRIWKIIGYVLLAYIAFQFLLVLLNFAVTSDLTFQSGASVVEILP